MGWLLVLGLKEGLVECATVCIKSWVILPSMSLYILWVRSVKNRWKLHKRRQLLLTELQLYRKISMKISSKMVHTRYHFLIITIDIKGLQRFSCHGNVTYLLIVATLSQGPLRQMDGKALKWTGPLVGLVKTLKISKNSNQIIS